jgi:aldehyde dehydrogenase (NAD+)
VNLTMLSLVAALSAGNCALIKPSEVAPASAAIIEKIVREYLDGDCIKVVQGAVPETTALLRLHWDHIIYTGNGAVARLVMRAASQHLTPCTLELGGKSPVYVDKSAKLSVAVKRLLAGKGMNNGQTCIAPDHVFVHEAVQEAFLKELLSTLRAFYGEDPRKSASYGRIVNHRHWDRVARLMKPESHKGQVLCGGLDKSVREDKYIAPTVILNPSLDSPLMSEEIFGFVLPVITVKSVEQAVERVSSGEHPLALYVFSEDQAVTEKVLQGTTSGGVCVNDTLYHIVNPYLPFGGIGSSGMGAYHGKHGFVEMSHKKAVMYRSTFIDAAFRYPPYSDKTANALKGFAAKEPMDPNTKKLIMTAAAGLLGAVVMSRL